MDKICAAQCKRKSIRTNFMRIKFIRHSVNGVLEMISVEVEPKGAGPFVVVAWYRPPTEPVETFMKLANNIDFFDRENKEIIILGDTNCDLLKVTSAER